jgi:hypothetical protein
MSEELYDCECDCKICDRGEIHFPCQFECARQEAYEQGSVHIECEI